MTRHEDDENILRDGQSVRVPLYLRDGAINPDLTPTQRGKAAQQAQTQDAVARRFGLTEGLQLHKPVYRRVTDAAALERVFERRLTFAIERVDAGAVSKQ